MNTSLAWETDSRVPETPETWVFYFKNLFGGACPKTPLGSSSLRHCALRRQKILRPVLSELCPLLLKTCRKPCDSTFFISSKGYNLSVTLRRAHEACDMGEPGELQNKTVHTTIRFCLKTHFFPPISPTVHLYSVKMITELRIFSKTLSRMKIFENAGFRIRWRNASFTASTTHALQGMLSYFHCLAFSYGRAKTIRMRYVWMRIFSENGGKNLLLRSS